jgi:hypothetical protein
MSTLILSVGIAVMFLTVWGVIMVGSYLIGREPDEAPAAMTSGRDGRAIDVPRD